MTSKPIAIETEVNAEPTKAWDYYTDPDRIVRWNSASEDWHCPSATNDLRVGGKFSSRMESRDGSQGFDFAGVYDEVIDGKEFAYTMEDGRHATVTFEDLGGSTRVSIVFDAEDQNSIEMQRDGWQAILDEFKKYTEAN